MGTTLKSKNAAKMQTFDSFEDWSNTFLPSRNNLEINVQEPLDEPSETGKMIAMATLQRLSSLSKDRKKVSESKK